MITSKLEQLLTGRQLSMDIGKGLGTGWNIFKQAMGQFIVYLIVYGVLSFILQMIPFLGMFASLLISPVLAAGFYYVANDLQQGQEARFERFFAGFSQYVQIVVTYLIGAIILFAIVIVGFLIAFGSSFIDAIPELSTNPNVMEEVVRNLNLAVFIPTILLTTLLAAIVGFMQTFALIGVVTLNLSIGDAWRVGFNLVKQNFLSTIGLIIVAFLLTIAGTILLFIGLLWTLPLIYLMMYGVFYHAILEHIKEEETPGEPMLER